MQLRVQLRTLACLLVTFASVHVHADVPTLTLAERVDCEQRIQAIYSLHRAAHGPDGVKSRLDDEVVSANILDALKRTRLLAERWHRPLSEAAIDAEVQRIGRASRDPGLLKELYAALGNDPVLVGECIIRPLLTDRLSQHWYWWDHDLHDATRADAEADLRALALGGTALTGKRSPTVIHQRVKASSVSTQELHRVFGEIAGNATSSEEALRLLEGVVTPLNESAESFDAWRVTRDGTESALDHWQWPKRSFEDWWASVAPALAPDFHVVAPNMRLKSVAVSDGDECRIGEWTATRTEDDFYPRWSVDSTAVWTGSEMLVYGSPQAPTGGVPGSLGGLRYSPATDSWRSMSRVNQFQNNYYVEGVWSGSELLLWGGCRLNPANPSLLICDQKVGARYNPTTDTWRAMSEANAPSTGVTRSLQWLGNKMFAWGGGTGNGAAATYNPVADTWTPVAAPPGFRLWHYSLWTGNEVLIFGGFSGANGPPTNVNYAFKPSSNSWRTIAATGAPALGGSGGVMRAWSGTEALIFAPQSASAMRLFRYDPSQDVWSQAAATGTPSSRIEALTTWAGDRLVVWGGLSGNFLGNGAMYLPSSDAWVPIRSDGAPAGRRGPFGIWTGEDVIVWGGIGGDDNRTAARLDVTANTWTPLFTPSNGAPSPRKLSAAASDGIQSYIWSGGDGNFVASADGRTYSPALDSWSTLSSTGAPSARFSAFSAWSERGMIVFGGAVPIPGSGQVAAFDGGVYDPVARQWSAIASVPWATPRDSHIVASTSGHLLVWSGYDGANFTNSGYSFDLAQRSWSAMTTIGAPSQRFAAVSATHQGEVFVWGGSGNASTFDGGIFNPASNTWRTLIQSGDLPQGAGSSYISSNAAQFVDAGDYLILWDWQQAQAWTYEIATGVWRKSSMQGRPQNAGFDGKPTLVWSGKELLFWGGNTQPLADGWPTAGYGYNPSGDHWRTLETENSPGGRTQNASLAVGSSMMIWGGDTYADGFAQQSSTGGLYCMDTRTGLLVADVALDANFSHPVVSIGSTPAVVVLRGRNMGPETATQVQLETSTTSDFVFIGLDADAGITCTTPAAGESGTVSCSLGSIQSSASKTVRISLSAFATGNYNLAASISASESDNVPQNNDASAAITVIGVGDEIFSSGFD